MHMTCEQVGDAIDRAIQANVEAFAPETIQNAKDFVAFAEHSYIAPDAVGKGYWPTVRLSWSGVRSASIEIEVHSDHYEFYRFFDGRTDIMEFSRTPPDPIPQALAALLNEILKLDALPRI
jgi:hypothetical protein